LQRLIEADVINGIGWPERKGTLRVDLIHSVILVGDSGVGKTSLLKRYVSSEDLRNVQPTLGIEYQSKLIEIQRGQRTERVRAKIWDTAGQERYKAVTGVQLRYASGALVVFDLTNRKSFENVKVWLDELPNLTKSETLVMIVGSKKDLVDKNPAARAVQTAELAELAKARKCLYQETSAFYAPQSIEQTFSQLVKEILQREDNPHNPLENSIAHSATKNDNADGAAGQRLKLATTDPDESKSCC